ncbi:MAG: RNA polymerase sigma factor [Alphaproteobacteria bacterium]|nr:RNA polymerase sigma factor [Alphaproteobacteria bacterium]
MTRPALDDLLEHRQAVLSFVMRLVGNAALADDLTQEAFLRATRTGKGHRGEASRRSWLCAIALNLVRDHLRALGRSPDTTSDEAVLRHIRSEGEDAETGVLKKEMADCIAEYLFRLPPSQHDVVALHDMADLSHREIADQLRISEQNSRVLLHRGRSALRKILEENCVLSVGGDAVPCERPPRSGTSE